MDKEKVSNEELAQKIDELLSVLKVISGDLTEVSKSLKTASKPAVPQAVSAPPAQKKRSITDVKQAFSSELEGMLLFEEKEKIIIVRPRRFLGSDNFAKIASIIRNLEGEYVSAGKKSHFEVPKG